MRQYIQLDDGSELVFGAVATSRSTAGRPGSPEAPDDLFYHHDLGWYPYKYTADGSRVIMVAYLLMALPGTHSLFPGGIPAYSGQPNIRVPFKRSSRADTIPLRLGDADHSEVVYVRVRAVDPTHG